MFQRHQFLLSLAAEGQFPATGPFWSILVARPSLTLLLDCQAAARSTVPKIAHRESATRWVLTSDNRTLKVFGESTRDRLCSIHTRLYLALKFRSRVISRQLNAKGRITVFRFRIKRVPEVQVKLAEENSTCHGPPKWSARPLPRAPGIFTSRSPAAAVVSAPPSVRSHTPELQRTVTPSKEVSQVMEQGHHGGQELYPNPNAERQSSLSAGAENV